MSKRENIIKGILLAAVALLGNTFSYGQLTGSKSIPGDYATIAAAVTAVNSAGVGTGGVTFNIAAGYTETNTAVISLTATGTATNPITFRKDPLTSGANPLITAHTTGTSTPGSAQQDGIFRLIGSDYVTIDGIDLTDNAANTTNPSTMEYGYGLYRASTSNGCQNVTIRNCKIKLNRDNNATGTTPMTDGCSGIIMMNATATAATTALTIVSVAGTNSNNKFYSNTISNCNVGMSLIGYAASSPYTLGDANNDIGGATAATANTILNFGGGAGALNTSSGIRTAYQYGLNVSNNIINSNDGNGVKHPMALYGIVTSTAISASTTIHNNTVTLHGGGTTQNVIGIYNVSGATPAANTISIRNNTVTNCTYTTSTKGGFYGIYNTASPASLIIKQNTVSNNSNAGDTTGFVYGITNSGAATVINIDSNSITGNSADNLTTGIFAGIYNTGAGGKLSISYNTFSGNTYAAVLGVHYGVYQYASVTDSVNINSNIFGTPSSPAITYSVANAGAQAMIYTRSVGSACALSISNNLFRNVAHTALGTGTYMFIYNVAIPLYQNINSNVFSNLSINTAASLTLISNNIATPANGVLNVSNNSIIGGLTKATGNSIIGYTSSSSASGSAVINHTGNNFSYINAVGTTTITGWSVSNFGSSTVTISGNTFSNWTAVTGAINGMSVSISSVNNNTTGNFINNITTGGAINGITTSGGNDRISNNIINTITSTGATTVSGISMAGGTSKHIFGNKIYDLQSGGATGTVNGISSTGNTSGVIAAQIYNNVIGDLRVPAGNAADPVRGINLNSSRANSSIIVSHNTIYLTSSSTGALFGTSGIYQAASGTSTTASLTMRNNIIANLSVTNGASGRAVAFRRSSASLGNYNVASNNNMYYSGTPSVNRLLYFDGTNSDQTLATFKTRMVTRDAQSVTEDITQVFLSTAGSTTNFLHLDPTVATQAESGGTAITNITTDIDGQTRQGNSAYTGAGTAPDMGADEFEGIEALPLTGTYTVGVGGNYPSLTNPGGLFAAINSIGLAGDVEVNVISDLTSETGSYALNQWAEDGVGNYTLTIQSAGGILRNISGNVAGPLIKLDGADRVTFDGSDGGTFKHLLFKNTNTLGTVGTAFTFINGATENVLRYCAMEAYANATNGVVLFSTSATALGGNSNNLIEYCDLNATSGGNTGIVGIYSAGTTTAGYLNTGNSITNSNIYNFRERGIDIAAAGNTGWTITGNQLYNGTVASSITYGTQALHGIRVLGGSGYTISNNNIGGSAANAGGTQASYAIASAGLLSYQGILLTTTAATPASVIKGNVIANIALTSFPTSNSNNGSNVFMGIETNGSGISIGGTVAGEGNRIGSNTANGSISITTNTTFKSNVRGINCQSTGGVIIGNQVGGWDIRNIITSGTAGPTTFMGILAGAVSAPSQVNNNIVGSTGTGAASNSIRVVSTSTCTTTILYGIAIGSTVTSAVQVDGNKVQNFSHLASVTSGSGGGLVGILNSAAGAAVINITNNQVLANNFANYTSAIYYGIYNSGSATTVNMNNNTVADNISGAAAGAYSAILNAGTVTTTVNINNNSIGTSVLNAITYSVASSGSFTGLNNTGGGANAALSISNNTIYGINYVAASTGANNYISNSATTKSQAINGNIFSNINVNTTGTINFIVNNVVVGATGTQNISNNSIAGSYTRKAGGSILIFNGTATSVAGGVINHSNNNFSNISISGTTPASNITGWTCTDAGGATRTVQNNVFNNWTNGTTGTMTAMSINQTNSASAATGNTMNNISGTSTVTGILTAAGNDRIFGNTISNLISSGAATVSGISITAGTTKNIYRNKIYDLQATAATGSVYGVSVSGTTVVSATIYNNLIGRLYNPNGNSGNDLVRGISVAPTSTTSSINVYYNTIYLDAASATSGANFSTSGVYHTTSTTATTSALNMRNNIIVNVSTPKGTGNTVAYRRSSTALNNYASTSNNNLFYAGTPGTANLIFRDGTNNDQTITAYKTRVANRDSMSQTENLLPNFLSVVGTSPVFLHMDATIPSIIVNGAVPIAGVTDDYDGQVRYGNPGYTGSGYAPDMGADETFGIEVVPPAISYTPLNDTTATANRELAGVVITDGSGINTTVGTKPRIYYKRFVDANTYVDNTANTNGWKYTEATNSASPFKFTIDYNLLYGGNTGTAGIIQYFVEAQDQATTANVGITSGVFAADPLSVDLTSAAFPITGTINSYKIPFAGSVFVGLGEVYGSLTKADGLFSAINSAGLKGNVDVYISSDLAEDGANVLNQWTEYGGSNYKMTIHPDGSALRIISGNVPNGLIRLNGVDRLKIDGSFGDSLNHLTFRNTNTAVSTGSALSFDNGATADSFVYCNFEAAANTSTGVVKFGGTTGVGNSNNYFGYNNINATVSGTVGLTGIYSAGTVGAENTNNVFQNNNIYNYQQQGLNIASNSSAWTINGNSFYNGDATGSYNFPAGSTLSGIWIDGGAGYTVSGNYIGGNANHAAGTNAVYNSTIGNISYYGIRMNATAASPASSIKGNIIARITLTPTPIAASSIGFTGIETAGGGINIGGSSTGEGNLIGANTGNGSITYTTTTTSAANSSIIRGINVLSSGGSVLGNQVAGVDINNLGSAAASSLFQGINIDNVTPPASIHGNIIGSFGTGANNNSIRVRAASLGLITELQGIAINTSVTSAVAIDSNSIQNIAHNSTTSSGSFTGILNNASAAVTISKNVVRNLTTGANTNANSGIYTAISSASQSTINNNTIENITLSNTGNASQLRGIYVSGNVAHIITSNTVNNLNTASTKTVDISSASPTQFTITGIVNNAAAAGQQINGNTITALNATNTTAIGNTVGGICLANTSNGNIYNNRVFTLTAAGTGTATVPGIAGIVGYNGGYNCYNNVVSLTNGALQNGIRIYGVMDASNAAWYLFYNTVQIGGTATGTVSRTAAFLRSSAQPITLTNNVFLNTRSGAGNHFAISNIAATPATNWTASDHNDLYSSIATKTGEWGNGTAQTFAQWKLSSGMDAASVSRSASFLSSTADLEPNPVSNCALDNAGIAITTPVAITTDIMGIARSTTPDMGAYEFGYVPFDITPDSNTPVCAGSDVDLEVDPEDAINPTYVWLNPLNAQVATTQNPTIPAIAGRYKVTVTDVNGCFVTDSTTVVLNARPTATITGGTTVCEETPITLTLHVTGTGTISGTFNTGDAFSGTAPTINVVVVPSVATDYFIQQMSDANCVSLPVDIADTVTVGVITDAYWTGSVSNAWGTPGNWQCGAVPDSSRNVVIPSGLTTYPVISSGVRAVNDLRINNGASLTITNASLQIWGSITKVGTGVINGSTAHLFMLGDMVQTIPSGFFSSTNLKNLTVNNAAGVVLAGPVSLNGILKLQSGNLTSNGNLTLASTASGTALVDGTGTGNITGNVKMQRYLPSGFGYKYLSSPVQAITVNELANDIDLNASFPTLYRYNEDISSTGFMAYTTTTSPLLQLTGYAANFGATSTAKTADINGVVNNGTIGPVALYNHNQPFTKGFNLVGNPYPSPIDWNAASGWSKTNIDNAVYYFNAGSTNQYTGTYSSYINGVSSDGVANNIIPSMQGFFVHVANGSYPVMGSLGINNNARVNGQSGTFHKTTAPNALIRLALSYDSASKPTDKFVAYFNDEATPQFEGQMDALKLMNTDDAVPNLYALSSDFEKLSVYATTVANDGDNIIPLSVKTEHEVDVVFNATDINEMPIGLHPFLYDASLGISVKLEEKPQHRQYLTTGTHDNRYYLIFSKSEKLSYNRSNAFNVYSASGKLYVTLDLFTGQQGDVVIRNMLGQVIAHHRLSGFGSHELPAGFAMGVYIVSFTGSNYSNSKKVMINN